MLIPNGHLAMTDKPLKIQIGTFDHPGIADTDIVEYTEMNTSSHNISSADISTRKHNNKNDEVYG
jgi:hypothetical protein